MPRKMPLERRNLSARWGKSATNVFFPPCEGGIQGVLRVPPHCSRLVIQAIENRSKALVSMIWVTNPAA